jgi:hypothetical protein
MERIYLEKLGEQDYEKIRQIREWLRSHPRQGMLLAFPAGRRSIQGLILWITFKQSISTTIPSTPV